MRGRWEEEWEGSRLRKNSGSHKEEGDGSQAGGGGEEVAHGGSWPPPHPHPR